MRLLIFALMIVAPFAGAWAANAPMPEAPMLEYSKVGKASFYSSRLHGRRTASGIAYDQTALTAAHPDLPFGTLVCVTNMTNQRSVQVEINDRGPYTGGRIIDLSRRAAQEIGMINAGSVRVRVEACEAES